MLLRVGNQVINLDNVMNVYLDWEDEEGEHAVVFEFVLRGSERIEDDEPVTQPYLAILYGEEAEAVRTHLKKTVPDLLA